MVEHEFREIVRICDKDIKGKTKTQHAISLAKGSSFMFANAVCAVLKIDRNKFAGDLNAAEREKIEDCMRNPLKYGIPSWLLNRRKDLDSGEDMHLMSSDLTLKKQFDIRFLRKIKSYKGIRHSTGQRVRGQRTRSTGRTGKTLGVQRKKRSGKK